LAPPLLASPLQRYTISIMCLAFACVQRTKISGSSTYKYGTRSIQPSDGNSNENRLFIVAADGSRVKRTNSTKKEGRMAEEEKK
jgi:hypothetical protein